MNRTMAAVTVMVVTAAVGLAAPALAVDASDYMGLSPEQMQQVIQNNLASDRLMLEIIRERNRHMEAEARRQQESINQGQSQFAGCVSLGQVSGKTVEEAIGLGQRLGGDTIYYLENTPTFVRGNIYRCRP